MTSEQMQDWMDGVASRLIHCAARCAPNSLIDRLEEEWLADLAEQRGTLARLRFAIGCCWATRVIARERVAAAPLAAAATPQAHFVRFPRDDSTFFNENKIAFVLVVSLHVALLYGLAMGMGPKFSQTIASPFLTPITVLAPEAAPPS
jgi:hypothetical protein